MGVKWTWNVAQGLVPCEAPAGGQAPNLRQTDIGSGSRSLFQRLWGQGVRLPRRYIRSGAAIPIR